MRGVKLAIFAAVTVGIIFFWTQTPKEKPSSVPRQQTATGNPQPEGDFRGYRNDQFHFAFEYPKDWKLETVSYLPQSSVIASGEGDIVSFDTHGKDYQWNLAPKDATDEKVEIDGLTGTKSTWEGDGKLFISYHALRRDDIIFTVQVVVGGDRNSFAKNWEKMLSTIRFH